MDFIHGKVVYRDELPKTKWDTADDIPLERIRNYLCTDGRRSWEGCAECESRCKFGEKMLDAVRNGDMEKYSNSRMISRPPPWQTAFIPESTDRASGEVRRVYRAMGKHMPDWIERLMEDEAQEWRKRFGPPRVDDCDVDVEVLSAVVRAQGCHNFSLMDGG